MARMNCFAVKVTSFPQKAVQSWGAHLFCLFATCAILVVVTMQMDPVPHERSAWPGWAESLRRHGLENLVAWLLEAAGPLTVLGAQVLYFGGPLLRPALTDLQREALAGLLEDRDEALAFTAFLREEISL
jgi:hypothetical protein